MIYAHNVIGVAIRRALRYWIGYSHRSCIFRISRSFAAANNVIREGHRAARVIPNIHSCSNSVMDRSGKISLFPRGYFASRGSHDDPP